LRLDPEPAGRVVVELTEQWAEGTITRREWEDAICRINSPLTELSKNAGMPRNVGQRTPSDGGFHLRDHPAGSDTCR
jgi:hypothetical protein